MPLELVRPDSIRAAAAVLAADASARFLGGGTLLVRNHSFGDLSIGTLVLCDGLGLDQIRIEDGRVELGAAVTMAKILAHPGLAFLHDVAREIGGPAVRAMATIGGNLFAPSPYGDFSVALLALGAEVTTEDASKSESTDLEAFLKGRGKKSGRIVKSVTFALPPSGAFRFVKVTRRHPHGASLLSIAALLPIVDGRVKGARVAYGVMAPTAIRARAVEKALEGKALNSASIADAAAVAGEGTAPASDSFASAWYRANVLPVHLGRLLNR
jgi:CO/xanthine dehydrogenase FAD-binding subunit